MDPGAAATARGVDDLRKQADVTKISCTIDGCDRGVAAKGLCSAHYQRQRKHGNPLAGLPLRDSGKTLVPHGICRVEGCERRSRIAGRSLCGTHYQRWRKHGDPTKTLKNMAGRYVNGNGYVMLATGSPRMVLEHREVMERALDRPLLSNENVHHLNGDRADNRLENLELWVKRQPPGQRVTDRIEDAVSLLRQYAPHLLAAAPSATNVQVSAPVF
jgi:hypothetical protein